MQQLSLMTPQQCFLGPHHHQGGRQHHQGGQHPHQIALKCPQIGQKFNKPFLLTENRRMANMLTKNIN